MEDRKSHRGLHFTEEESRLRGLRNQGHAAAEGSCWTIVYVSVSLIVELSPLLRSGNLDREDRLSHMMSLLGKGRLGPWNFLPRALSKTPSSLPPHSSVSHTLPANSSQQGDSHGEGNGTPLQYSCLENPMDRGAW